MGNEIQNQQHPANSILTMIFNFNRALAVSRPRVVLRVT